MEHILSLSYGKDSLVCLGAIDELGWPLDRIIHTEIWATDDIPGELPPMFRWSQVHQHYTRKAFQNDLQTGDKLVVSIKGNGKNKK